VTVIAGLVSSAGWGYLGSDIGATNGDLYSLMADPKVMRFDQTLVGYAGDIAQGRKAFRWLMDSAALSKVNAFERHWTKDEFGDTDFLFIEQGRIYELSSGAVIRIREVDEASYAAIGEGSAVALGALYVDHIDLRSVLQAIDAAIAHVPGIYGPPMVIECSP
jgi:hypothetical protein